ncbi:hypothetical protein H5410_009362 [Solanum commersonii]|uniref:Uncharacterized protein n=1 Tax=Solanum commersonii TaxID=4109 RepID=A0A9J6AHT8_SOLCO|nr:hypothetical protein H5410_009362 [Solanum commersonii]
MMVGSSGQFSVITSEKRKKAPSSVGAALFLWRRLYLLSIMVADDVLQCQPSVCKCTPPFKNVEIYILGVISFGFRVKSFTS